MLRKILTRKFTRPPLKAFVEKYAAGGRTLDLGCSFSPYKDLFPDRVGFDNTEGPDVDVVGDAHNLPFDDETFEVILCTEVLEHLHTPERAVQEMHRVLKPGGIVILTTRFIFPLHAAPNDYFRYTKYGLKHLFREWEIVELQEELPAIQTFAVLLQDVARSAKVRGGVCGKYLLYAMAQLLALIPSRFVFMEQLSNKKSGRGTENVLTSGYYMACRKSR